MENKTEIEFYQASLTRVAKAFGINSPLQLMARAKDNEQTYVDILIDLVQEAQKDHKDLLTKIQEYLARPSLDGSAARLKLREELKQILEEQKKKYENPT